MPIPPRHADYWRKKLSDRVYLLPAVVALAAIGLLTSLGRFSAVFIKAPPDIMVPGEVNIAIGESAVLHGARSEGCEGSPPDWSRVKTILPETRLGVFYDGGLGVRYSRVCNRMVPARIVVFTATKPGLEKITLFDNLISIEVR